MMPSGHVNLRAMDQIIAPTPLPTVMDAACGKKDRQ
jgi:hypothetical protein